MLQYLVLVSASVSLISCLAYIRSMFAGKAKPNRVSWLMWGIAPMITVAAALSDEVRWAVLPVFMAGLSPLLIFTFSFVAKNGYWKSTVFDYACGVCSALALVLWAATEDPNVAIALSILADVLAAVPTISKAWTNPESERPFPFMAGIFGGFTSFLAIKTWTFSSYAFPVYLVSVNVVILSSLFRNKFIKSS